jgi:hypothetical protein
MAGLGFDPFRAEQTIGFEPAEQWVDGTFRDDQACVLGQLPDDFQSVTWAGPLGSEDGEFEATFSELNLPFFGGIDRERERSGHWMHDTLQYIACQAPHQLINLIPTLGWSNFAFRSTIEIHPGTNEGPYFRQRRASSHRTCRRRPKFCAAAPRPAWLAINGRRIDRRIGQNYSIAFAADGSKATIEDPVHQMVKRFAALMRSRDPFLMECERNVMRQRLEWHRQILTQLP